MAKQHVLFSIESAPGDPPAAVEQPNGDLLVPAEVRSVIACMMQVAELALEPGQVRGFEAFAQLKRLLALDGAAWQAAPDPAAQRANLLKSFPLR